MDHSATATSHSPAPAYLRWLIPALAVLLILFFLAWAVGVKLWVRGSVWERSASPVGTLALGQAREEQLRRNLALLQETLLAKQAQCKVPAPVTQPAQLPGAELVIPKAPRSADFLQGCWRSITDLVNLRNQTPIEHEYCFGEDGNGEVTVRSSAGYTCKGSVKASVTPNRLTIETLGDVRCDNGSSFEDWSVNCETDPAGQAVCSGVNKKSKRPFSVKLLRK